MIETKHSFCRMCINQCSILVTVDGGRVVSVDGNPDNPLYAGYTCVKGRAQPKYLYDKSRLLKPLRRSSNGSHVEVSMSDALAEISERLGRILNDHGPRAVAAYSGSMAVISQAATGMPFYTAFLDAIGTNMRFDPNTIDKGGKQTAQSFLGYWQAPPQGFDSPEVIMLVGANPWLIHTGFPAGSPKRWLQDTLATGCTLIVIDPRETHVAQRADHFLRSLPGHDIAILAAMIKVIVEEELFDRQFVADHVRGLGELRAAMSGIDIAAIAAAADIEPRQIVDAARCYAGARRGFIWAGTGPHMSGFGTLAEYLVLVIQTLCGRWLRAGEKVMATPTLLPKYRARAQASPPDEDWALKGRIRVRGLKETRAGMPSAALTDEILLPGEGQVRALISWAGNPAISFLDQKRTVEALKSLDLFVQIDPWYNESARLADFVLPTTMPLEMASASVFIDWLSKKAVGYGQGVSHAQYTAAMVDRPPGSDLLEDWEIFFELMVKMGYPVAVRPFGRELDTPKIQLDSRPATEDLLKMLITDGRVPLEEVKQRAGGAIYDDDLIVVEPAEPGSQGRLDVGSAEMLRHLHEIVRNQKDERADLYPFRLLCRRMNHVYNTYCNTEMTNRGVPYNPAFLHPEDMDSLSLKEGDAIVIASSTGSIKALAHADPHLRRGMVSMAYGYGIADAPLGDPANFGSSTSRLIPADQVFDPYTGQPRMTNVPVSITAAT